MKIPVKKLSHFFIKSDKEEEGLFRATSGSAGIDLVASIKENIDIKPGEFKLIPSGIAIGLPDFHEAQIRSRSGLASKHGIVVFNSPGTIDSDYRGEIHVLLINHSHKIFSIEPGMRIAQLIIAPYVIPEFVYKDELEASDRGKKGFGSSGL